MWLGVVGAAAEVPQGGAGDDEVGREHGGSDFAAVGAVADEGCDEAGGAERLKEGGDVRGGGEVRKKKGGMGMYARMRAGLHRNNRSLSPRPPWTSHRWRRRLEGSKTWICQGQLPWW